MKSFDIKRIALQVGTAVGVVGTPAISYAQNNNGLDLSRIQQILFPIEPSGGFNLQTLFQSVFGLIILIAAIIAILYLVWAGIQYITASTDEEKAKKARTAIYNAIIGIVVIILSYAIIVWVGTVVRTNAPGSPENTGNNGGLGGFGGGTFGNRTNPF